MNDPVYVFELGGSERDTAAFVPRCLAAFQVATGRPLQPLALQYDARRKPYFPEGDVQLSISHSDGVWVCAMSAQRVGIDVQHARDCQAQRIAHRFFHPREADYCARLGMDAFFTVWVAKESFVKFTGQGIDDEFGSFCVLEEGDHFKRSDPCYTFGRAAKDGYLCVCTGQPQPVVWLRWQGDAFVDSGREA